MNRPLGHNFFSIKSNFQFLALQSLHTEPVLFAFTLVAKPKGEVSNQILLHWGHWKKTCLIHRKEPLMVEDFPCKCSPSHCAAVSRENIIGTKDSCAAVQTMHSLTAFIFLCSTVICDKCCAQVCACSVRDQQSCLFYTKGKIGSLKKNNSETESNYICISPDLCTYMHYSLGKYFEGT